MKSTSFVQVYRWLHNSDKYILKPISYSINSISIACMIMSNAAVLIIVGTHQSQHYLANMNHATCAFCRRLSKCGHGWRHQMETFPALLAICAGNTPVPGGFRAQRQVTQSFDAFFDLRLNKRLCKQSWGWWFETPSCPIWRHNIGFDVTRRGLLFTWWSYPISNFQQTSHAWRFGCSLNTRWWICICMYRHIPQHTSLSSA